jgi:hypothetical protein
MLPFWAKGNGDGINTGESGTLYLMTGATSGAKTPYPSGAHEFTPVFSGVRVTRSLVLYVCFVGRSL